MLQNFKLALVMVLMLFAACSDPACFDLVYNAATNECECPPGTEPNYETQACEGADGQVIPWTSVDPGLRPSASDSGVLDMGPDVAADIGTISDAGIDGPVLDAEPIDVGADAADAGPPPGIAQARFPWNGFATGSVHVPDAEPIVNHPLRPKFMWEEVADADHYQIQMTRSCPVDGFRECDFATVDHDETTENTTYHPATSLPVSMAVPVGSRYYWRVRACSASEACSDWTEVRYLNVGRDEHDYNGDGYADVAVGAPHQDLTETDEGVVYVFFGSADGVAETPSLTLNDPVPQYEAKFGTSVTTAGDVNADGFSDLAVGAPGQSNGAPVEGNVFIYHGSPSGPTLSETLDNPMNDRNGEFGAAITGGGDLNADGYSDIAAGALKQGPAEDGAAYVFLGASDTVGAPVPIRYPRPQANARFGVVGFVGDTNGDGRIDLLVGAPDEDGELEDTGRAFFFFGRLDSDYSEPASIYSGIRGTTRQRFGAFATGGDFNGDGFSDLTIAAPVVTVARDGGGGAYVFDGSRTGPSPDPDSIFERRGYFTLFGVVMASVNTNGDDYDDLFIGAPREGAPSGAVHLLLGSADGTSLDRDTRRANPLGQLNGLFGLVASLGDINGDGYVDVGVGASYQDLPEVDEGAFYVYEGSPTGIPDDPSTVVDNPLDQANGQFGWASR